MMKRAHPERSFTAAQAAAFRLARHHLADRSAKERVKKPTLTAETAETAKKSLGILGDLCVLCG
jgi:hypothetical protein